MVEKYYLVWELNLIWIRGNLALEHMFILVMKWRPKVDGLPSEWVLFEIFNHMLKVLSHVNFCLLFGMLSLSKTISSQTFLLSKRVKRKHHFLFKNWHFFQICIIYFTWKYKLSFIKFPMYFTLSLSFRSVSAHFQKWILKFGGRSL